jgi:hypothetical protein
VLTTKRVSDAKRAVRTLWRESGPNWAGIAPSHLCTMLECDYAEATELMLALEEQGFVRDSGWGGPLVREDGREGTNRFWPLGWGKVDYREHP